MEQECIHPERATRTPCVGLGSAPILRIFLTLRTEPNVKPKFETVRDEHKLVARMYQAAREADARRILIASAHSGDGKSHLGRCIQHYASLVSDEAIFVRSFSKQQWETRDTDAYVWVDGLALLENEGAAALSPSIRSSLDGAIIVARGMHTTRAQVRECAEALRGVGLPVLGGVWNELSSPSPRESLAGLMFGRFVRSSS